jgi:hypothetical protein
MVTVVVVIFTIPYYLIPLYGSIGIVAVMTLLLEMTLYHYLGIVAITIFTPPD